MGLVQGVGLDIIENHLAVLFAITIKPERGKHAFERVLDHGKQVAHEVMQPWRQKYGISNTDYVDGGAFGRDDVAKLEDQIIASAERLRVEVLNNATLFCDEEVSIPF